MGEIRMTSTSIFIVPTLKIDKNQLKDNNFINGYIRDLRNDVQYENAAYLLFKPGDVDNFQDFVDGEYERTPTIIDDYDYDGGFVVLVYTLNPKYIRDFELIKKGMYSKTSEEFQELFPKIKKIIRKGKLQEETSLQHRVFNKTDDLKEYWYKRTNMNFGNDMELWNGFDEKDEVLDIEEIKKQLKELV